MMRNITSNPLAASTLLASITLILLASIFLLRPSRAQSTDADANPISDVTAQADSTPCPTCGGADGNPRTLAASYYSIKDDLTAILMLNNKGPEPLDITPTLFSLDGQRWELSPVTVEAMSFREIDMREFGIAGTPFERGSLQLVHRGADLVIGAQVKLIDEGRSLIFEEKLLDVSTEIGAQRLEGLWYSPTSRTGVRLILSNTSDAEVPATVRIDGIAPKQKDPLAVTLSPHETRVLDAARDIAGNSGGTLKETGGITVEHASPAGSLLARVLVADPAAGYSSSLRFYDPQKAKSTKLQGAGLRIGEVAGEELTPVITARNVSSSPTTITGRIPYTKTDGQTGEVTLPALRLAPGETKIVETGKVLKRSGVEREVATAGLEFDYTGAPGGVIMTAQSMTKNGDDAFQVPMWDIAAQRSATGGYPWSIDGTSSTFVYIKNVTDHPQEYTLQISFAGGVYAPGLKKVAPGQTVALDVRALRDEQTPDEHGQTIPLDAERGQVQWSSRGVEDKALIGRMEQADIPKGLSTSYACQNCCPDSFYTGWLSPGSADVAVGGTLSIQAVEQRKNCFGAYMTPFVVYPYSWNSSNTAVMAMTSTGMTGMSEGNAQVYANWNSYVYGYGFGMCRANPITPGAGAPVTVVPTISIGRVQFTKPAANTDGNVVISGQTAATLEVVISVSPQVPDGSIFTVDASQTDATGNVTLDISPGKSLQVGKDIAKGESKTFTFDFTPTGAVVSRVTLKALVDIVGTTTPTLALRNDPATSSNSLIIDP